MNTIYIEKTTATTRNIIKDNIQVFLNATNEVIDNYDVSVYGNFVYLFVNDFADMYIFKRTTAKENTVFEMWNSEEAFEANIVSSAGKRKFKLWAAHSKRTDIEKQYAECILNSYETYFGNIIDRHYKRLNDVKKIDVFKDWTSEQIDDKYWIRSMKNTTVLIAKNEENVQVKKLVLKNGNLYDIVKTAV
jgi:hypothetical protein